MSLKVLAEPRALKTLPIRSVSSIAVANKYMWLGLNDGTIRRYPCEASSSSQGMKSNKIATEGVLRPKTSSANVDVQRLFVDAKSFHCIACLSSGQHCYFNFQGPEPMKLTTLRGTFIRSLCFTDAANEDITGSFLIGTQQGSLIEGRINYRQTAFSFRTQYTLPESEPVLDISIVPIVHRGSRTHVVIVLSTRCLYEFFGGMTLEATFSKYSDCETECLRYEVPLAGPSGELLLVERTDGSHNLFWTNATGIVFVNVPYRISDDASSCLPPKPTVITYPSCPQRPVSSHQESRLHYMKTFLRRPSAQVPRGTVALNNTLLLLFDDTISVVNTIVGKQVGKLSLPSGTFGKVVDLVQDRMTGDVWILSNKGVFEVVVCNDSDNAWQHYLLRGDTQNALSCCKTSSQRDSVLLKAAYEFYESGMYVDSARMFGQVESAQPEFENVCLKFLKKRHEAAALEYISLRIRRRNWYMHDPRFIIITMWIIELLGYRYRDLCLTIEAASTIDGVDIAALERRRTEFKNKLFSTIASLIHVDDMASPINFLLQTMMGCGDECVDFAKMRKDYTNVICYHISGGNTEGAFYELLQMPPGEKRDGLLLRFAPLMFMNAPHLFYKSSFSKLDPTILLPVVLLPLMMGSSRFLPHAVSITEKLLFDDMSQEESIRSLLWCCYIILLANMDSPDRLLKVLSECSVDFSNSDMAIALRYLKRKSATDSGWMVPFIMLQSLCGMNEDALDMALSHGNLKLAEDCANRPSDDFVKRRLWRRILKHCTARDDVSIASILEDSEGKLHVHDVLQFIPDDVKLGELREMIKDSVRTYEENLQDRRREIEHLCTCIEETKAEIQMSSRRCVKLSVNAQCTVCNKPVSAMSFIVFPCAHAFHRSCVASTLRRLLCGGELLELQRLQNAFDRVGDENSVTDYNDFLSRACLICGYSVDMLATKPFISAGDIDQVELWNIG